MAKKSPQVRARNSARKAERKRKDINKGAYVPKHRSMEAIAATRMSGAGAHRTPHDYHRPKPGDRRRTSTSFAEVDD